MRQYGSPHVTADAGRAEGSAGSGPCLPSLPLSRRSTLPLSPGLACSSSRSPLPQRAQSQVAASPDLRALSPQFHICLQGLLSSTLSSGSGLCPSSLPSGSSGQESMLSIRNPWASPPMLLHQHLPHPCDGTTSQLSSGLCNSPFSPLHGPPVLTSSPLLPMTLLMISHLFHGTG